MAKRDPSDRRVQVLHAVVERYLATSQPVGSAVIARQLPIKASPATIRNDMAELEDAGYLEQPHTSAGRVPTVRAYRLLVDRMVSVIPLSAPQREAISSFLSHQPSMEDTLRMAARLLARITGQIAMVSSPSFTHATLRRLEIVPLSGSVFLLIVISDTGRVEQRTIVVPDPPDSSTIADLSRRINASAEGRPVSALAHACQGIADGQDAEGAGSSLGAFARTMAAALKGLDDSVRSDSLYMAGTARLTKSAEVSRQELSSLLDALEEQVVMMRLLSSVSRAGSRTGVGVAIGEETHLHSLLHSSVVSSAYVAGGRPSRHSSQKSASSGNHGGAIAQDAASDDFAEEAYVGSIGPTHIDYPSTMAAVKAVANYLSTIIGGQEA